MFQSISVIVIVVVAFWVLLKRIRKAIKNPCEGCDHCCHSCKHQSKNSESK